MTLGVISPPLVPLGLRMSVPHLSRFGGRGFEGASSSYNDLFTFSSIGACQRHSSMIG
jgi:hypothetical protein